MCHGTRKPSVSGPSGTGATGVTGLFSHPANPSPIATQTRRSPAPHSRRLPPPGFPSEKVHSRPIAGRVRRASGFLQTLLSKVTRRSASHHAPASSRRVTPDRVLTSVKIAGCAGPGFECVSRLFRTFATNIRVCRFQPTGCPVRQRWEPQGVRRRGRRPQSRGRCCCFSRWSHGTAEIRRPAGGSAPRISVRRQVA